MFHQWRNRSEFVRLRCLCTYQAIYQVYQRRFVCIKGRSSCWNGFWSRWKWDATNFVSFLSYTAHVQLRNSCLHCFSIGQSNRWNSFYILIPSLDYSSLRSEQNGRWKSSNHFCTCYVSFIRSKTYSGKNCMAVCLRLLIVLRFRALNRSGKIRRLWS